MTAMPIEFMEEKIRQLSDHNLNYLIDEGWTLLQTRLNRPDLIRIIFLTILEEERYNRLAERRQKAWHK